MRFFLLIAMALVLAACSTPKTSGAWYVGTYTATLEEQGNATTYTTECPSDANCSVVIQNRIGKETTSRRIKVLTVAPMSTELPNNNLSYVRQAVLARPSLYDSKKEGPLLNKLRPVLEGSGTFSSCVDISAPSDAGARVLCKLTSNGGATWSPVLGLITMNPVCRGAFCAYYFLPLDRP